MCPKGVIYLHVSVRGCLYCPTAVDVRVMVTYPPTYEYQIHIYILYEIYIFYKLDLNVFKSK